MTNNHRGQQLMAKQIKNELDLQNDLKRQCQLHGISFDKVESRSRRGFPDCFLVQDGRIMLVEVKTPTGKGRLSALQKVTIERLRHQGVNVKVLDSVDQVDAIIQEMLGAVS
jgi:hypothetical protein